MPLTQPSEQRTTAGECRQCRTFCDRMVEPRGCLELRCRYLYSYLDPLSGARYMGCMRKVFRAEIDMSQFEAAERGGGYGGIKMTGDPLPYGIEPNRKALEAIVQHSVEQGILTRPFTIEELFPENTLGLRA